MDKFTDDQILKAISHKFKAYQESISEQLKLMKQLEFVNLKLQESEKVKGLFLSNIRNELINPLTSIGQLAHKINKINCTDPEKVLHFSNLIMEEISNLDFQLKNIFMAAAIESGEVVPEVSKGNIGEVVYAALESQKILAQKLNLHIETDMCDEVFFNTDTERLQLIISNLINNAIKYSPKGRNILITASVKNKILTLVIKDDGIGIPEADQKIIFDRFTQLDSGFNKMYQGQGLGLALVNSLLEILNGSIEVLSEPDKGSKFTIFLKEFDDDDVQGFSEEGNEILFDDFEKF